MATTGIRSDIRKILGGLARLFRFPFRTAEDLPAEKLRTVIPGFTWSDEAIPLILNGGAHQGLHTDKLEFRGIDTPIVLPASLMVSDLLIEDCPNFRALPEDLFAINVTIRRCENFNTIPATIDIRSLTIEECHALTSLADGIRLTDVQISRCDALTSLPNNFYCQSLYMPASNLSYLGEHVVVDNRLNLEDSKSLVSLPNLKLREAILRNCVSLTSLPEQIEAQLLDLSGCMSFQWPGYSLVEINNLDVSSCARIQTLPDWLTIADSIDVANTAICEVPASLKNCRLLWRGVPVDERIAFHPETITAQEVLAEPNAERRRVMLERFGWERFVREVKFSVRDSDRDPGGERSLLHLPIRNDEDLLILSVSCPSTGRRYFIRVPPQTRTCRAAAAWVAGYDNPDEYEPVAET